MSQKPKPRKQLSKATLHLNEQLARKRGIRELRKRVLIVCEDDQSAPNYFEALKTYLKLSAASVEVVRSGGHTQPHKVVRRAVKILGMLRRDGDAIPFDQVWCVVDGDYGPQIAGARLTATDHGVRLAVTTQCFEYWVLLHFEENDKSTNDCDALVHALKATGHLPDYTKGGCDFSEVVPRYALASQRAKKLRQPGIARGALPENQNPCSELYELIEVLGSA